MRFFNAAMAPAPLRARQTGFTLAETLISLSITAMLMLAMGGAFTAAGNSVEQNDRFFRSEQQARVALDLIVGELRRCQAVTAESSTSVSLTASATDPGNFAGASLTFTYNTSGQYAGDITMTNNTASTTTILASDVTSATFNTISPGNYNIISLAMSVDINQNVVTLSDSAAPRYLMGIGAQWN